MSAGPEPATAPKLAIIGSTSPVGKLLREILDEDRVGWKLTILDTNEYAELLQEFRSEIEIVRVISPDRLEEVDVAVFTCAYEFLNEYLGSQAYLPPVTIDATGGERNGPVFVDIISDRPALGHRDPVIAPRADTIILSRILDRRHAVAGVEACEATILESAAEKGNASMDRLAEETVQILNFNQGEDKSEQLAFNWSDRTNRHGGEQREWRVRSLQFQVKDVPHRRSSSHRYRFSRAQFSRFTFGCGRILLTRTSSTS